MPAFSVNCRLPVYVGPPGSGGFVVFPGNTYISDPTSAVVTPTPSPEASATPTPPPGYGPGYSGLSYDRQFSKWVPVPPTQLAPDGVHYAFVLSGQIYGHDLRDSSTKELAGAHSWSVIGVSNNGAYATVVNQAGLWFVPFSGATPSQLTNSGFWQAASSAAVYGTVESAVPQGVANQIIQFDLTTNRVTNYFKREGATTTVMGIDARGQAILQVGYFSGQYYAEVWVGGVPLFGSGSGFNLAGAVFADGHGVWFPMNYNPPYQLGSAAGIVLYVTGGPLYWMTSYSGIQIGGACV